MHPFYATVAPLGLAAIWTSVAALIGLILWGLWQFVSISFDDIGHWYLDRMIAIAQMTGAI
ncbi:MAG: hypothetical protein AAGI03_17710 [Pseudomonadota bacterium]